MRGTNIRHTFLEPPKGPSDLCPRLNGFYSHPDPGVCHIFYACVDGTAEEYTCSSGLWFDEYSGVCNWPEVTDRKECKADAYGKISSLNVSVKGLSMNSRRLQNPVIAKEW